MPHNFEQDRQDHRIHNIKMPQGHGWVDGKHQKMNRAPIVSQLPMANSLESPQADEGITSGDAQGSASSSY